MKEDIRCVAKPFVTSKGFDYIVYLTKEVPVDISLTSFHIKLSFNADHNEHKAITMCSYFFNYRENNFYYKLVDKQFVMISKKTDYMSHSVSQMFDLISDQPKRLYQVLWQRMPFKVFSYLNKSKMIQENNFDFGLKQPSYWDVYERLTKTVKHTFG